MKIVYNGPQFATAGVNDYANNDTTQGSQRFQNNLMNRSRSLKSGAPP
jgi:hypothetical protein